MNGYPPKRRRVAITFDRTKGKTQQQFQRQANINTIMDRFHKTGTINPELISKRSAAFTDVSDVGDYMECQIKVRNAQEAFATLPSAVRSRFRNDPAELIDFIQDKNNQEEAVELGLIEKPKPAPEPAPETAAAPAAASQGGEEPPQ